MRKQQAGGSPLQFLKLTHKKLKATVINDHMLLVPGVLTPQEAQKFIDAAEGQGFEHQGSRGPAFGEAYRDNHRISMQDPALAEQLWSATGLKQTMAGVTVDDMVPVGLNPNIRFYRYSLGQKFGRHIDDSVEVAPGQFTGYTLLIYLSGQLDRGTPSNSKSTNTSSRPATAASSSSSSSSSSRRGKQKAAGPSAPTQVVPLNTSAVQDLVGGETVFYGAVGAWSRVCLPPLAWRCCTCMVRSAAWSMKRQRCSRGSSTYCAVTWSSQHPAEVVEQAAVYICQVAAAARPTMLAWPNVFGVQCCGWVCHSQNDWPTEPWCRHAATGTGHYASLALLLRLCCYQQYCCAAGA